MSASPYAEDGRVKGWCPMGCGETLFVGTGGHVTCSYEGCTNPSAADEILRQGREHEHVVEIHERTFTIQHPLRERLGDPPELLICELHDYMANLAGPPRKPGRYHVRKQDLRPEGPLEFIFEELT